MAMTTLLLLTLLMIIALCIAASLRWSGRGFVIRPGEAEPQALGEVDVKCDEIMRACGGAVAGVRELPVSQWMVGV
jgi:hypothetical protein